MSRVNFISGKSILIGLGLIFVIGVMVWQGVVFTGVPNATGKNLNLTAAILSCGVLVFREGLEAILVLSAINLPELDIQLRQGFLQLQYY